MKRWPCYLCPQSFVHGRHLAGHLIELHGLAR